MFICTYVCIHVMYMNWYINFGPKVCNYELEKRYDPQNVYRSSQNDE